MDELLEIREKRGAEQAIGTSASGPLAPSETLYERYRERYAAVLSVARLAEHAAIVVPLVVAVWGAVVVGIVDYNEVGGWSDRLIVRVNVFVFGVLASVGGWLALKLVASALRALVDVAVGLAPGLSDEERSQISFQ